MRSNRRRFLFVALLTAIMWYWHLTFTKIDPNLTHLAFSPTRENLSDAKLFVHQKEIVRTNLGRRKAESSNERLVDPNNWLKPNVLLKDDMEKARERPACLIPQIDPFHDLAMKEMRDVGMINCSRDGFGFVADGQLILKASKLRFAQIQYIQRPAGDDDEYILSEPTQLIEPNKGVAQPETLGCLVADKRRVLEFEDDFNVVSSTTCTPDAFLRINRKGVIQNLHGKILTIQECSAERCSLALSFKEEDALTRFTFENNGQIVHIGSSKCLVFKTDKFDNFDELVLLDDCRHPASWWTMYHYPENDVNIEERLTGDFIKLSLLQQMTFHVEYHAIVIPMTHFMNEIQTRDEYEAMNVALIILESQSAANIQRKMPRIFSYLKNAQNAFVFKGHTIVGDGTTDQLCAMLIGRLEQDLADASRSSLNSVFVDDWKFIFGDFRHRGYVTLFSEDDLRFPAFSYRLNGFRRPPTDHYARVFWQSATTGNQGSQFCIGMKSYHKVSLDYTESLFDAYVKRPKFSVTILSAESHNNVNNVQYIEGDLVKFLSNMEEKGHLFNTFVFIVGDHGLRASLFRTSFAGWLEERLPFFALFVPDAYLRGDKNRRHIIDLNARYLTSHFDIYATLHDILNNSPRCNYTVGNSLLRPIDYSTRTCKSAGIEHHWCPCRRFNVLGNINAEQEKIALSVIDYINALVANTTHESRCANLVLDDIKHVSYSTKTTLDSVDGDVNQTDYLIVFSVLPSSGIFEASVTQQNSGDFIVDPNISRLDIYGYQPICIIKEHPNLRKFCYCSKLFKQFRVNS